MIVSTWNEWDPLRTVVVGTATNANWPYTDPVFAQESKKTTWTQTPVPQGPVPQWIIDEANRELDQLATVLYQQGVEVWRPDDIDFVARGGMYNYCPRDRLLIVGQTVIDPAMMYPCRDMEIEELQFICDAADQTFKMPRDQGMIMDAANVCRLGKTLLYLVSPSGNLLASEWLQQQLPDVKIETCEFYSGVHIDSTVVPLQEGLVLLNGDRVNLTNTPKVFDDWEKIYVTHVEERSFYQYPYASKWIGMNMLVIRPGVVVVDSCQTQLIELLKSKHIETIALPLTHSRTLGGGFHCVTLDIHREA